MKGNFWAFKFISKHNHKSQHSSSQCWFLLYFSKLELWERKYQWLQVSAQQACTSFLTAETIFRFMHVFLVTIQHPRRHTKRHQTSHKWNLEINSTLITYLYYQSSGIKWTHRWCFFSSSRPVTQFQNFKHLLVLLKIDDLFTGACSHYLDSPVISTK